MTTTTATARRPATPPARSGPEAVRRARVDVPSLVAGLAVAAVGAAALADRLEVADLRFGAMVPIVLAAVGAILLASGLSRRG